MGTFCIEPKAKAQLPDQIQPLVDAVAPLNRSARASVYAFLDEASPGWVAKRVHPSILRELRAYNLRSDRIWEPWHIDARYGAFFGSADPRLLDRVVELTQQEPAHPLHSVALWSLNSLCRQYPHIAATVKQNGGEA